MSVMMQEIGDADPCVRRALEGGPPVVAIPIWLATHRELETNRRMRVVFDCLADELGALSTSGARKGRKKATAGS